MHRIEKAHVSMFDEIHELLGGFGERAKARPRSQWMSFFDNGWDREEKCPGWVIIDQGKVVAFISTLFSDRTIRGRVERVCNINSWIVKNDPARTYKGRELLPPIFDRDVHLMTMSARGHAATILRAAGLDRDLDTVARFVPDAFALPETPLPAGMTITHDLGEMRAVLGPADLRILEDHVRFNCQHVLLHGQGRTCYVVSGVSTHLGVNRTHYISDPELFAANSNAMVRAMAGATKIGVVMIEARIIHDLPIAGSYDHQPPSRPIFRSPLDRCCFDNLYTEMILLEL